MNAKWKRAVVVLAALALMGAGPAVAEDPVPVDAPDAGAVVTDDLEKLLDNLSPEQVESLIKTAMKARLSVERQQVIAELREGLLYDPDDVDEAVKILTDKPADTQQDNIDRILRAFAKVDGRFGKPFTLFGDKKYAEAAVAAKQILDLQQATYFSAAKQFLYAQALIKAGQAEDGVEAYRDILTNMPERISFAATGSLRAAEAYEKLRRKYYAMEMYAYCLKNYGMTLSQEKFDELYARVQEYTELYKDPLGSVAKLMDDVKKRLKDTDSGDKTQEKQEDIVALLEDLIKTAEEQQQQQQKQQQQQQQKGEKPGEQEGKGQGQGQGQGQKPQGNNPPSNPAQVSALVPGAVQRPTKLSKLHQSTESGDWAQLPPRERERIQQIMKSRMSERYRQIIKDYMSRLAEETP